MRYCASTKCVIVTTLKVSQSLVYNTYSLSIFDIMPNIVCSCREASKSDEYGNTSRLFLMNFSL